MRKIVERSLRQAGVDLEKVVEASNGAEALAALQSNVVDLILCDINMPVMDGLEFVRQVGAVESAKGVDIVILGHTPTDVPFCPNCNPSPNSIRDPRPDPSHNKDHAAIAVCYTKTHGCEYSSALAAAVYSSNSIQSALSMGIAEYGGISRNPILR